MFLIRDITYREMARDADAMMPRPAYAKIPHAGLRCTGPFRHAILALAACVSFSDALAFVKEKSHSTSSYRARDESPPPRQAPATALANTISRFGFDNYLLIITAPRPISARLLRFQAMPQGEMISACRLTPRLFHATPAERPRQR